MGISLFKVSGNSYPESPIIKIVEVVKEKIVRVLASDPDPLKFDVLDEIKINKAVVVVVRYPDCTNYEGKKVLVFDSNYKWLKLKRTGKLDPHFTENTYSPVARFEPTDRGIELATKFTKLL
jgi:hypothetical protein